MSQLVGMGRCAPSWDLGWLDERFLLFFFPHHTTHKTNLTKYLNLQVRSKDGHVDHCVVPQRSPGCGGCLPAGWQAVRRGWIRRPVISEHCRVLRSTEQRVDRGNHPRLICHSFDLLFCYCFRRRKKSNILWCIFCTQELYTRLFLPDFVTCNIWAPVNALQGE